MTKATIVKPQDLNSVNKPSSLIRNKELYNGALRDNFERSEYFNGKFSELWIKEEQATSNSKMMDWFMLEMNEDNKTEIYDKIREEIGKQYKELCNRVNSKDIDFSFELSDEQINSIIEAHRGSWKLWELTRSQLKNKVGVLKNTIWNSLFRRFLLESWFCWSAYTLTDRFLKWELTIVVDKMKKKNLVYSIWDYVLIPRTNGTPCLAMITNFDSLSQRYQVQWKQKDWQVWPGGKLVWDSVLCYKRLGKELIDKANSGLHKVSSDRMTSFWDYCLGEKVLIPRNWGTPFLAEIMGYSEENGFYVGWIEKGQVIHKWIEKWEIDNLNQSIDEKRRIFFTWNTSVNLNNFYVWNYAIWDYTLVPGTEYPSLSIITWYDQAKWEYTLERISYDGKTCQKKATREDLIDVNKCLFKEAIWPKYAAYRLYQNVLIPRTHWTPSVAMIVDYDVQHDEFVVLWKQGENRARKIVSRSQIDEFNNKLLRMWN